MTLDWPWSISQQLRAGSIFLPCNPEDRSGTPLPSQHVPSYPRLLMVM